MKIEQIVSIVLTCLLAVGCSRQLSQGEVISKRYEPASDFVTLMPMIMSCGQNCTTTMMIPYWVHDDEDFIVTVRGKNDDGEIIEEDWYLTEDEYNKTPVGRVKVFSDDVASRDDEHEKLRKADS